MQFPESDTIPVTQGSTVNYRTQPRTIPPPTFIPKGVDPPNCDCDCHPSRLLKEALILLEEKIGIVKCCHCRCWG